MYQAYKGEENLIQYESTDFKSKDEFWQWNIWYVFPNPDAQKREEKITKSKAYDKIRKWFKRVELPNAYERRNLQQAHEDSIRQVNLLIDLKHSF